MVASTAKIGLGALLKIGDGQSPEVFTAIANVVGFTGPAETMETVDITHLASTGGYREWLPHLKDGGEVSITMQYDPLAATQGEVSGLKAKYDGRTLTNFQVDMSSQFASKNLISFSAYVTQLGMEVALDNVIQRPTTLRITGPVVIT